MYFRRLKRAKSVAICPNLLISSSRNSLILEPGTRKKLIDDRSWLWRRTPTQVYRLSGGQNDMRYPQFRGLHPENKNWTAILENMLKLQRFTSVDPPKRRSSRNPHSLLSAESFPDVRRHFRLLHDDPVADNPHRPMCSSLCRSPKKLITRRAHHYHRCTILLLHFLCHPYRILYLLSLRDSSRAEPSFFRLSLQSRKRQPYKTLWT